MIDFKGNYPYIAIFLFLGLFIFRFLYGGGHGGSHMAMGMSQGSAGNQNYAYIAMGFMILMFFLRFFMRRP
ncbi:hypothetical protein [Methanobacterium ferruginis]|jgi:hypothetical protein|uniref:hypothetical protein n=1 Tax=Methanobacterium ferruginis TaxID=710191 RepID=UPI0025723C0F|nr:hypothetical protein [Methanobacterium ferruginis]BDZ67485.1 hypothetical protein GCM10025860_09330 [Methanobacterium ferruginis]